MKPRAILTGLLALVLLAGAARAAERLLIPQDLSVPLYIRGFDDVKAGWTATIFYRPPDCVPNNYNLLSGPAFDINPKCPLLMEGFALWEEGAPAPSQVVLDNVEGEQVPIYFVEIPELYAGIADGKLTVNELEKMDSLLVGSADFYHEVFHPLDAAGNYQISILASGTLDDGRSFYLHCEVNPANYNVTVRFEQ